MASQVQDGTRKRNSHIATWPATTSQLYVLSLFHLQNGNILGCLQVIVRTRNNLYKGETWCAK